MFVAQFNKMIDGVLVNHLVYMMLCTKNEEGVLQSLKEEVLKEEGLRIKILSPDVRDTDGSTLLNQAVYHECFKVVEALLFEYHVDINLVDSCGMTPLHCAVERGNEKMVALLLDRGANIEAKADGGITPLHLAAGLGHMNVVKILLERGAQINTQSDCGDTPLHVAVRNSRVPDAIKIEMCEFLLEQGADENIANKYWEYPETIFRKIHNFWLENSRLKEKNRPV